MSFSTFTHFNPVVELLIAGSGEKARKFTQQFHMSFAVSRTRTSDPNQAFIEILNLAEGTRGLFNKEFTRVILRAGYTEFSDTIFAGEIVKAKHTRNGPNIITQIEANDSEAAWAKGVINESAKAGRSIPAIIRQIVSNMPNVSMGRIIGFEGVPSLKRPFIMNGMARDRLNEICRTYEARWSIQNGVVEVVRNSKAASKSSVVKLTHNSGLLSIEPTEKGIVANTLLNPSFKPNDKVTIESRFLNSATPSSTYRINSVRFKGATYGGQTLQSQLDCQRMGQDVVEAEPTAEQAIKTSAKEVRG